MLQVAGRKVLQLSAEQVIFFLRVALTNDVMAERELNDLGVEEKVQGLSKSKRERD